MSYSVSLGHFVEICVEYYDSSLHFFGSVLQCRFCLGADRCIGRHARMQPVKPARHSRQISGCAEERGSLSDAAGPAGKVHGKQEDCHNQKWVGPR
jgi:hypothetical protein